MRLHYAEAGSGPLVVLLHGFPDFWYSWRRQIPALADAGFRVVAPDLRGYNRSEKPAPVSAYRQETLVEDVAALVEELGGGPATVVGHDWGGAIAWAFAMSHPDALARLVILNCPHPSAYSRALRHPGQIARSSYMFFFQLPRIPETLLGARRFTVLRKLLPSEAEHPGAFTNEDLERYVTAATRSESFRGGLNYYRAAFRQNPLRLQDDLRTIEHPVLIVWGAKDGALRPELAAPDPGWVPNATLELIPDASHWVHMDAPDHVNSLVLDFVAELKDVPA